MKLVKSNFQFLAPEGGKMAPKCTYPFVALLRNQIRLIISCESSAHAKRQALSSAKKGVTKFTSDAVTIDKVIGLIYVIH